MAKNVSLKEWLAKNGGPSILLHLEHDHQKGTAFEHRLIAQLLEIDEVNKVLSYLDPFSAQPREKKALEHLLHYYKETCIDQFFPRLMDLGFQAGMEIFDQKMEPVRELYAYLLSVDYGYIIMISRFFFIAGYAFQEVIDAVRERIHVIYQAAEERIFDIYQDKGNLPKTPKHWEHKGVIRDDLNPWLTVKPLPVCYDIAAMAHFPDEYLDSETKEKIDVIITYILDPRFQQLPEGYGLLWEPSRRRFLACGWSPTLPLYLDYPHPKNYDEYSLLYYVNMMSHFTVAQDSQWFRDCMQYLEQYQTEDGTFVFPKELLHQKYVPEAFLNASNLTSKRHERVEMLRRIASTLFIYKIHQRINERKYDNT